MRFGRQNFGGSSGEREALASISTSRTPARIPTISMWGTPIRSSQHSFNDPTTRSCERFTSDWAAISKPAKASMWLRKMERTGQRPCGERHGIPTVSVWDAFSKVVRLSRSGRAIRSLSGKKRTSFGRRRSEDAGLPTPTRKRDGWGRFPTNSRFSRITAGNSKSYVQFTDLVEETSIDPYLTEAAQVLGEQAGSTIDILVRNVMSAGTNINSWVTLAA